MYYAHLIYKCINIICNPPVTGALTGALDQLAFTNDLDFSGDGIDDDPLKPMRPEQFTAEASRKRSKNDQQQSALAAKMKKNGIDNQAFLGDEELLLAAAVAADGEDSDDPDSSKNKFNKQKQQKLGANSVGPTGLPISNTTNQPQIGYQPVYQGATVPSAGPPAAYGGAPNPYGGAPNAYGGTPNPYGGAPNAYGGAPNAYGGAPNAYGGAPNAYGGAAAAYGGAPAAYAGAPPVYGGAPAPYPGAPATYAGAPPGAAQSSTYSAAQQYNNGVSGPYPPTGQNIYGGVQAPYPGGQPGNYPASYQVSNGAIPGTGQCNPPLQPGGVGPYPMQNGYPPAPGIVAGPAPGTGMPQNGIPPPQGKLPPIDPVKRSRPISARIRRLGSAQKSKPNFDKTFKHLQPTVADKQNINGYGIDTNAVRIGLPGIPTQPQAFLECGEPQEIKTKEIRKTDLTKQKSVRQVSVSETSKKHIVEKGDSSETPMGQENFSLEETRSNGSSSESPQGSIHASEELEDPPKETSLKKEGRRSGSTDEQCADKKLRKKNRVGPSVTLDDSVSNQRVSDELESQYDEEENDGNSEEKGTKIKRQRPQTAVSKSETKKLTATCVDDADQMC